MGAPSLPAFVGAPNSSRCWGDWARVGERERRNTPDQVRLFFSQPEHSVSKPVQAAGAEILDTSNLSFESMCFCRSVRTSTAALSVTIIHVESRQCHQFVPDFFIAAIKFG